MRAPKDARIVIARAVTQNSGRTGVSPKVVWLVREVGGDVEIRFRLGGGYHPTPHKLPASVVLRDATPRERTLGFPV